MGISVLLIVAAIMVNYGTGKDNVVYEVLNADGYNPRGLVVSDIIKKYAPIGSSKVDVERYLIKHGFQIIDRTLENDGSEKVIAQYRSGGIIGHQEIRVIFVCTNNIVIEINGYRFHHYL